jgi:hypothetical protein
VVISHDDLDSAVAIIGVFVVVAWRYLGLKTGQAFVCLLAGFLLAATSAAPVLHRLILAVLRALTSHSPPSTALTEGG